jgi:hypothetical protein
MWLTMSEIQQLVSEYCSFELEIVVGKVLIKLHQN